MTTYYETDSEENECEENDYSTVNKINDLSTDSSENETINEIQNNNNGDDLTIMKKLVDLTVKYENDLKKINDMKKVITNKLKKAKEQLVPYMQKKEIDHINLNPQYGGGKIKYNRTKVYSSLTKKKMTELFKAYFKNEEQAKQIIKFLYDNREFKFVNKVVKTKK